jgi:Ca2+-binding RTX toxin-like protein
MIMARIDGGWGFTYWQKDTLIGTDSADEIRANGGDDFVDGGAGSDKIWLGDGNDTAYGGTGRDTIWGDDGNDRIYGEENSDVLYGGNGNDYISGGADHDTMDGGTGTDTLSGGDGRDVLDGGRGDDELWGDYGSDTFTDVYGNNTIRGGTDANGLETDTLDYTLFDGKVTVNLSSGSSSAYERTSILNANGVTHNVFDLVGTSTVNGIEQVLGSRHADSITGSGGNDILQGGSGTDTVSGGGGNDTISGGHDLDTLTGGAGQDVFLFNTQIEGSGGTERDVITDFNVTDDTIQFDNAIFTAIGGNGQLAADAFHRIDGSQSPNSTAQDAEDRIIYDSFRGDIYYDADGTGSIGAVWIARVSEGTNLSVSDFFII